MNTGYPLNNNNYNWERHIAKKIGNSSGGEGGDDTTGLYSVYEFLTAEEESKASYLPSEAVTHYPEVFVVYDEGQNEPREVTIEDIKNDAPIYSLYKEVDNSENNYYIASNGSTTEWLHGYFTGEHEYNGETWYSVSNGD